METVLTNRMPGESLQGMIVPIFLQQQQNMREWVLNKACLRFFLVKIYLSKVFSTVAIGSQ